MGREIEGKREAERFRRARLLIKWAHSTARRRNPVVMLVHISTLTLHHCVSIYAHSTVLAICA